MKDEIKEILNWLNQIIKENKESDVSLNSCVLPFETLYKLQDCITNLQQDRDDLDDCNRYLHTELTNLQEENNQLKEDFKRHIDRINELTERSDNLQQENERLKKENTKLYKKDIKIINELKEELETTEEKWNKDKQFSKCRTMEMLDYKSRNERTIENIDLVIELIKQQPTEDDSWILNKLNGFKYLLNGGDKE